MNEYQDMSVEELEKAKRAIIKQLNSGKFDQKFSDGNFGSEAKNAYSEAEKLHIMIRRKKWEGE